MKTNIYFFIISLSVPLRLKNVPEKGCRGNQNSAVYKTMRGRPQITVCRMCTALWITKSTNTLSDCVIFTAFPSQRLLQERSSMLRDT